MPDPHMREVEDYTKPFLAMLFLVLFTGFVTLWAVFGYIASLISGVVVHAVINRIPKRV